jgi:two-component system, NtrC family, sensor histidine kinase KinB
MKRSIRTKFTLGMIFLFLIILVLSVFSGYFMNKLSKKTDAILKENYLSVVYAREMTERLRIINQELTSSFIIKKNADSSLIGRELSSFNNSLLKEKNNITEPGEDKLVAGIDANYSSFKDSLVTFIKTKESVAGFLNLQHRSDDLIQQLATLSQMNGRAIEVKTDDAKATSKSALTQMTVLATLCFLIGMSFTFSFASYFNQRFFQLYYGIKELVSSNYDQRLFFDGKDEFHEISLLLNEMAAKLKENKRKMSVTLLDDHTRDLSTKDVDELKQMLFRIKTIEENATALIAKFEKK